MRSFEKGFYSAVEQLTHWLNSCDTSDMTLKKFRSVLYCYLLDMRPEAERIYYENLVKGGVITPNEARKEFLGIDTGGDINKEED